MKISACWIAKNEEKNILQSIESIRPVVDEIIVVDTGSTDNTVEVAKSAGARIEYFEWIGDFSAARNYALSLASGDISFFLDADEWFSPALTSDDREYFERLFTERPELESVQMRINNLNSQGAVKTTTIGNRIMRKHENLGFQKRIHEEFLRKNGDLPNMTCLENWALSHSGYTEDILDDKMKRNIELLEVAAEKSGDAMDRHLQRLYLVREYYQHGKFDESVLHIRAVLDEPDMIRRECIQYQHGITPLLYFLLVVSGNIRKSVSRKEIYRKVVEPFKKYINLYRGNMTIDLFYASMFDLKEDLLLAKIDAAIEASHRMPETPVSYYQEAEMNINHHAAQASLRRGQLVNALNYSIAAFKNTQNKNPLTLRTLLTCLNGQPATEIILFLNSQFDLKNPDRINYLATGTRMYGFRDVHAYYLDKKIAAGTATKGDYLYLLLLYQKYGDVVRATLEFANENNAGLVSQNIFLAAICAKDKQIHLEYKELLAPYSVILNAFFTGTTLSEMSENDIRILMDNFDLIAFAAGIERADEFIHVFSLLPVICFQIRAQFCVDNALYEHVFDDVPPNLEDYLSNRLLIQAMTMTGRCHEAFNKIKIYFELGLVDDILLTNLLAISVHAKASTDVKLLSQELYGRYIKLYDSLVDLEDVVRIGYVSDDSDKKKSRAYKTLTFAQFNKQLAEDAAKPYIKGLPEISEQAGAVYLEKSILASALDCYRFAVAQNHNVSQNRAKLSEIFAMIGNHRLAGEIKK